MNFEWDEDKSRANVQKHRIGFTTATAVFADPDHITKVDDRFDYGEERFITYGQIEGRVFQVVTTNRDGGDVVRIISARKANSRERKRYDNR